MPLMIMHIAGKARERHRMDVIHGCKVERGDCVPAVPTTTQHHLDGCTCDNPVPSKNNRKQQQMCSLAGVARQAARVGLVQEVHHDRVLILGAHAANAGHELLPHESPQVWIVCGCAVHVQVVIQQHKETIVHHGPTVAARNFNRSITHRH